MANDQSTFIAPNYIVDQFDELQDLRYSDLQNLEEYRTLKMQKNDGLPVDEVRLAELELIFQNKIVTSARWNKFQSALVGMQGFIKNEVQDYVVLKQEEMQDYIDIKQTEIQTEIDKFTDRGTFNPLVQYYTKNFVQYNDGTGIKTYLAIANPPLGTSPTNQTYFRILTITGQKGEDGVGIGLNFKATWNNSTVYSLNDGIQWGGILFASLIDNNVGNQPDINGDTPAWGIALDVAITTTKLQGFRTIASSASDVNFMTGEVVVFNPAIDILEVFINTIAVAETIDYTINLDNQSIHKISGSWSAGTFFDFRVTRNQVNNLVFSDGQSIADNTISKNKLTTDVQETLDQVEVNANKIGNLFELNPDILDENLVKTINNVYTNNALSEVSNLNIQSLNEGTEVKLDWENPTSNDLVNVEMFVSTTDISNVDYEYASENLTKIVDSIIETVTYSANKNTMYYFKVFAKYNVFGIWKISKGVTVSILTEDLTPPDPITNFTAKAGNTEVDLSWVNPINDDFSKVKILRKTDDYPSSSTDGDVVYEGTGISYKDTELTNNTTYYYRAFTVDTTGNINSDTSMQAIATPIPYYTYGVKIDTTNLNPETALTYMDDAVGFTPASGNNGNFNYGSWQNKFPFNQIKPCLYKNGAVNYYLNPNDYAKKADGSASDITSGNDGDVMVEFPKVYWKFETIGTDLYVRYSDTKIDSSYKCLAHMRGSTEKDKCYISAYLGYDLSSKLRSLSGKTPYAGGTAPAGTIGTCRTLAQANGSGYDQMAYFQLLMLQVLFIVMFKNRDSQTALGRGYVDGNSASTTTGGTNTKGMFYGETTGKLQNKFCGIEDFWGNLRYWIDGFYSDASWNMLIGTQNFNNTGSGYTNYGQGATANVSGYISEVQGGTETGFVVKAFAGSSSTHYADCGALCASCLPWFGGHWATADPAGTFYLTASHSASNSNSFSSLGARLLAL